MPFAQVLVVRVEKKEQILVLERKLEVRRTALVSLSRGSLIASRRFDQVLVPQHLHLLVGQKEHIVLGRDVVVRAVPWTFRRPAQSRGWSFGGILLEEQPAGGVDDSLVLGINEIDILCRGWDQVVSCSRMKGLSHGHLTARDFLLS